MVRQCASGHVRERCEAGAFLCMFCFSMSDVSPLDLVLPVFSKTPRRLISVVLFHDSDVCILFIVRGASMLALVVISGMSTYAFAKHKHTTTERL